MPVIAIAIAALASIATAADGSTIPVDVTVQDNSDDIFWQADGN